MLVLIHRLLFDYIYALPQLLEENGETTVNANTNDSKEITNLDNSLFILQTKPKLQSWYFVIHFTFIILYS